MCDVREEVGIRAGERGGVLAAEDHGRDGEVKHVECVELDERAQKRGAAFKTMCGRVLLAERGEHLVESGHPCRKGAGDRAASARPSRRAFASCKRRSVARRASEKPSTSGSRRPRAGSGSLAEARERDLWRGALPARPRREASCSSCRSRRCCGRRGARRPWRGFRADDACRAAR